MSQMTSGGANSIQTFLSDLFNARLILNQTGDFSLFDDTSSQLQDYSSSNTFIDIRPTATRRIMLASIPLEAVITTMRKNSLFEIIYTFTSYCWVDFDRRFEVAHTAKRQKRCGQQYADNAAVYLEALLRNVDTTDLTSSSIGIQINQTILAFLLPDVIGRKWVTSLMSRPSLSAADEAALWRQYGIMRYNLQFQNRFQYGIEDSIKVVNALGVSQALIVSSIPYVYRGLTAWTSRHINAGIWNDMNMVSNSGCSLVRNFNLSLESKGLDWDIQYIGISSTTGVRLMRANLGPFMNWDTTLIAVPSSLLDLVLAFRGLYQIRGSNKLWALCLPMSLMLRQLHGMA
ncbi:hypothetical protein AC1031_016489 [Aphanomyces cochlioides]|nr:hypothetical protein AC1031_016489 [Aphanomyces cochlioides]